MSKNLHVLVRCLLVGAAVATAGCSEEPSGSLADALPRVDAPLSGPARSVLFITMDTVRADHLSLYGYERPTTPNLEELGRQATVYTHARAAAPWTLPSHATMFTGLYPFEHGARTYSNQRKTSTQRGSNNAGALGDEFLTLAELFARNGYRTGAFVANRAYLTPRFALNQGFADYDVNRSHADEINRRALAWLDENGQEPFFLFLNYMDAHRPYNCAPSERFPEDLGTPDESSDLLKGLYPEVFAKEGLRPREMFERLIGQYDNALANLDAGLGQLFDELRERGLFDDLLIVVTSDHGEYFGEHRLIEHSKDVYEGALYVPLLVKAPFQTEGRRDDALISHAHIPGIVLTYADLSDVTRAEADVFTRHWPRTSLVAENYYSRLHDLRTEWGDRFDRVRQVVYDGDYKYIESSDGQHELYDLSRDPDELENLYGELPDVARKLATQLSVRIKATGRSDMAEVAEDLTDEEVEAMRAMGYLGDG